MDLLGCLSSILVTNFHLFIFIILFMLSLSFLFVLSNRFITLTLFLVSFFALISIPIFENLIFSYNIFSLNFSLNSYLKLHLKLTPGSLNSLIISSHASYLTSYLTLATHKRRTPLESTPHNFPHNSYVLHSPQIHSVSYSYIYYAYHRIYFYTFPHNLYLSHLLQIGTLKL